MYVTTITTRRAANGLHRLAQVHSSAAVRLHCSIHRTAWQKRAAERLANPPSGLRCRSCGMQPCAVSCRPIHKHVAANLLESAHVRLAAYSTRCVRSTGCSLDENGVSPEELTRRLSSLWSFGSNDVR